jgi:hypothetical protein
MEIPNLNNNNIIPQSLTQILPKRFRFILPGKELAQTHHMKPIESRYCLTFILVKGIHTGSLDEARCRRPIEGKETIPRGIKHKLWESLPTAKPDKGIHIVLKV